MTACWVATIGQALRELFAAEPGDIIAAYLFGSVARGTADARSDVDVAVLYLWDPDDIAIELIQPPLRQTDSGA